MMTNTACCRAWKRMHQERHCPTLKILQSGSPESCRHLSSCSHCRARLESARESADLGALLMQIPFQQPPATSPVPGDVRALRPQSQKEWVDEEGVFYNPPLLLVLTAPDAQGFVQAAQVFDEPDLQGDGDIPLTLGLVAEAWNTYAVPARDLDAVAWTHAGAASAERVLKRAKEPFADVDESSALYYFRLDECKVGSFFSLRLNMRVLNQLEEQASSRGHVIPFALVPRLEEGQTPMSPEEEEARKSHLESLLLDRPAMDDSGTENPLLKAGFACAASPFMFAKMGLAAAGALGALGRSRKSQLHRHKVLVYAPDADPAWYPAEVTLRKMSGKTLFSITCDLGTDQLSATVAVLHEDTHARKIQASWLRETVMQIDASFDGDVEDVDKLLVAVELFAQTSGK